MSWRAWAYMAFVFATGLVLSGRAFFERQIPSPEQWSALAVLTLLATMAQVAGRQEPGRQEPGGQEPGRRAGDRQPGGQGYYTYLVFFFTGMVLLPPALFVVLVLVPHGAAWLRAEAGGRGQHPRGYRQPFVMTTHIVAGTAARTFYQTVHGWPLCAGPVGLIVAALSATAVYAIVNHYLIGQGLVLVRGVSWHRSGMIAPDLFITDLVQLQLGYLLAVLWNINPWLILLALSPMALIYRVLKIPELEHRAQTDAKTGLWNAGHFRKLFMAELERARRSHRPCAVMMADLDLLRTINNTHGHLAGDAVLAGVGRIIQESIRDLDIAGRFGGEEFLIALPEATPAEASGIAEAIRQRVERTVFRASISATPMRATISIGIACYPEDATGYQELIYRADMAVYRAKQQGRNCTVLASDGCAWPGPGALAAAELAAEYAAAVVPAAAVEAARPGAAWLVSQRTES